MISDHGEHRSLVSWLTSQEKVVGLWIDEALSESTTEPEFVRKLEHHRKWLAARINELTNRAALIDRSGKYGRSNQAADSVQF